MKIILVILTNLFKYTLFIFIAYLLIANVTITIDELIDAAIKSFCLGIVLVPISLINHFSPLIAKNASYQRELEFNKPYEDAFKSARTLLKTMSDIELVDSDKENGEISLQSDYSEIKIKLSPIDPERVKLKITSTAKVYRFIKDFNLYVKDAKNIITTVFLHFDPDNYDFETINHPQTDEEIIQEFKPTLILYFRLIKLWFITGLTTILLIILYFYALDIMPNVSTIFFFIAIFLYVFYITTSEINSITGLISCPICNNPVITKKYNPLNYKLYSQCNSCHKPLLKTASSIAE